MKYTLLKTHKALFLSSQQNIKFIYYDIEGNILKAALELDLNKIIQPASQKGKIIESKINWGGINGGLEAYKDKKMPLYTDGSFQSMLLINDTFNFESDEEAKLWLELQDVNND